MVNAGRKRTSTTTSTNASGSKRTKLSNKKASSKNSSKAGSSKLKSQGKNISRSRDTNAYGSHVAASLVGKSTKQASAIGSRAKDGLVKDRKGKRVVKEYIDVPGLQSTRLNGNEAGSSAGSEEAESELDVADMLVDDDDEESSITGEGPSDRVRFLTNMDSRELSRWVSASLFSLLN